MTVIQKTHHPSAEAKELYSLLSSPHIQALLSSHDSVAQSAYGPVLPPLPPELPEDEEAMRIVCLVKNNQPLCGEDHRGSVGDGVQMICSQWSSLRRLTLGRLVPARRAWSREELRKTEEKPKHNREEGASIGGNSDDYAYLPPPVPVYSLSLPNSPVLYKKGAIGGHSRNIPTPGRAPTCPGMNTLIAHTAPSSPVTQLSTRQQGVSTLPIPGRQHGCQTGPHNRCQEQFLNCPLMLHCSTAHNGYQSQPKQTQKEQQWQPKHHQHQQLPELTKQCSMEERRSTVQTVASSIEHGTHDVRQLGQMMTDSVKENAQALNLLAEVVDKLQGLIVASKHTEPSPPCRPKQHPPSSAPPRVSSISPKVVRKPPTPYPHHLSSSSSFSCSSSSSSTSVSSCADSFATSRSPKRLNGGSKRMAMAFGATQLAGGSGSNGPMRFNNRTVSITPLVDGNSTGCLTTKKKKKNK
ncbi:hypothetical protein PAMP_003353 [Pampus punctatissimus]